MPSAISSISSVKLALMKPHTLPVKRRPAQKGILKRLSAVTGNRKQRVAAAATPDMEIEDSSSKISRALTIIFLIHIVAIALIFVHQKFLDGRAPEQVEATPAAPAEVLPSVAPAVSPERLPKMGPTDQPYIVRAGDNYTRIAAALQVDEGDLRLLNEHMEIAPARFLKHQRRQQPAEQGRQRVAHRQPFQGQPGRADEGQRHRRREEDEGRHESGDSLTGLFSK